MTNPVHNRIRKRLDALGLNPRRASLDAGGSADLVRTILRREKSLPSAQTLTRLAKALKTSEKWLLTGDGPETDGTEVSDTSNSSGWRRSTAIVGDVSPQTAVDLGLMRESMTQDLPVYGTAAGSFDVHHEGAFAMESRIVDYVRRPPALTSVPTAYAFYVAGTSMEPEHRNGDLRFVHPGRTPRQGDSVVVQARYGEHLGVEAFIAHFVSRDVEKVTVEKLNPIARVIYDARYVVAVHRVLTMNEMFGA